MLNQIIVLFNLLSFIIVTAILPADIKIETKLPEGAVFVKDSTYIIEVDITKGQIFGFAKFQQNVPEGYIAEPVKTSEASFTFADGKIKYIWMAIPEQEHIIVSYALTATSDAPAEGVIEGKLSYIEDNDRKSYDIPSIPIKAVSEQPAEIKTPAMANVNRTVKIISDTEYEVHLVVKKSGIEGFGKLEEYLPEGAEATVMNNNKAVFSQVDEKAKFVWMSVPEGDEVAVSYSVKATSNIEDDLAAMEGNFSFLDDNETKTVPVLGGEPIDASESTEAIASNDTPPVETPTNKPATTKPADNTSSTTTPDKTPTNENTDKQVADVVVQPKGTPTEPVKADKPANTSNTGTNNTTNNSNTSVASTEKAPSSTNNATGGNESVASTGQTSTTTTTTSTPAVKTPTPTAKPTTKPAKTPSTVAKENKMAGNQGKTADVPQPEKGITYKVQIVAAHKVVSEAYIQKRFQFNESFGIENHEGWVKYTTGSFTVYKGARDKRESIDSGGHNFPGPFVTAYNSGERITVQEALMISNQKWYK